MRDLASAAQKAEAAVISASIDEWIKIRQILTAEQTLALQRPMGSPPGGGPRGGPGRGHGGPSGPPQGGRPGGSSPGGEGFPPPPGVEF